MNETAATSENQEYLAYGLVAEEVKACLQAGREPDVEALIRDHPDLASKIRQLVPTLILVHQLGEKRQAAPEEGTRPIETAELPEQLGDFRILREIGRGGMGVVYEAEQISLKRRRVALKVLPFAAALDPRQLQRFQNEAQTAACLHHTNIVPVHAVGSERGVHFYAMQFIEGQSLAEVIADLRLQIADLPKRASSRADEPAQPAPTGPQSAICNPQSAIDTPPVAALSTERSITSRDFFHTMARLGIQAAEALDHAHQQGVLHRDIKPANLLLDVRGNLWITDFGLARFQNESRLSMTGDLVGTLRYMSPEQALAKRVVVDHRTDIYSLGVTLYELLTLEPVFAGTDRQELLRQIAFEEPKAPRRHNKSIPAELETIVLKALEKNPAERYATAQELADDLRRFLEDKPIRARRPTLLQRAARWRRRHPALVWSTIIITLILAASLGCVVRDWETRRMEAETRVLKALGVAEPKLRQGNPYDPELVSAARKAEAQLAGGVVQEELRQQVEQVLADVAMLAKLEGIRLDQAETKREEFEVIRADRAYAKAFREYGIDVEALGIPEAAAQIHQRAIGMHLAAALDEWAMGRRVREKKSTKEKPPYQEDISWKQLLRVAQAADPDQWRGALREALANDKWESEDLKRLAASAPIAKLAPETLTMVGYALRVSGAVQLAEEVLRQGQQRYPADFWINEDLGLILDRDKANPLRLEEAIGFLRAALALRPQSLRAHLNLGNALADKGQLDDAIACYREAIRLNKNDVYAHFNLGITLHDKGQLDEAIACYREAIRLDKDFAGAHHKLGKALRAKGHLDEAIACYRKVIGLKKDDASAHNNLGNVLQAKGHLDEAIACYREAIRLDKDHAHAHNNLGTALAEMGDVDGAIAEWRQAMGIKKDYAEPHYNLGIALAGKGDVDGAIAAYQKALQIKNDYVEAHVNLGNALKGKGQLDEAILCYRKAVLLRKDFAIAYRQLGSALHKKGQLDESIACSRKIIELKKDDPGDHYNLGNALRTKGLHDEAIACYREAITLKKDFVEAHNNLGNALVAKGRWAEAQAAFGDALKLAPNHPFPNNSLAWLLANCPDVKFRDVPQAVVLAKKATAIAPENGNFWNTLGVAHYRARDWKAAVADLDNAMKLRKGGESSDWFFLAMAHWQLGDKDKSRHWYDRAVQCMEKNKPQNEELRRFGAEAAALLGIQEQPPPKQSPINKQQSGENASTQERSN